MSFSLVGEHSMEALEPGSGDSIKSLGARGAEIEGQVWRVQVSSLQFEFHTFVTEAQVEDKREVLLAPSREFLEYIDGAADLSTEERVCLLHNIVEGLYFIFPTHFKAPICFRKSYPVAVMREGERTRLTTLSGTIWDAVELSKLA